jgi:S-adenosylmethionine synthetase
MSTLDDALVIAIKRPSPSSRLAVEICEHKGIGHPDSLCDGVAEAVAQALCREYLRVHGAICHFNVDKALLIGGASAPRFGGGTVLTPIRLIVAGRATPIAGVDMDVLVESAARHYIASTLHCDRAAFRFESAIRPGSGNLREIYAPGRGDTVANDTSVGVAYFPYSELEQTTLRLASALRSNELKLRFPAAGDDFKIMGARAQNGVRFTVALALIDREVSSPEHYFELKRQITQYLERNVDAPGTVALNMLDTANSPSEVGLYLTVTGLSAEQGDDGEVGRGNRMNGLITPYRPMSLEAVCGKNPRAHVGKLYNVLAARIAHELVAKVHGVGYASVQILSTIGRPIAQPQLVAIEVEMATAARRTVRNQIRTLVGAQVAQLAEISQALITGATALF